MVNIWLLFLWKGKSQQKELGPFPAWPDLPRQPVLLSAALSSLPDAMFPRDITCFHAFGPMWMLCLLAYDAHALFQSFLNSRLKCHQLWEAFPITPDSDSQCSHGPLSKHLWYDHDNPHIPALIPLCAAHAAKTGTGSPLTILASGVARCLLAQSPV